MREDVCTLSKVLSIMQISDIKIGSQVFWNFGTAYKERLEEATEEINLLVHWRSCNITCFSSHVCSSLGLPQCKMCNIH